MGNTTDFKEEYCEQARKLCLLGLTDEELAKFFNVCVATIYNWKNNFPQFLEATKEGKEIANANVADRLYRRAMGYEHDDVYPSSYQGKVTLTPIKKYYPPDTQAASLWLRNREPNKWRDKQELEHTGKDGKDLIPEVSDFEFARRMAFILNEAARKTE